MEGSVLDPQERDSYGIGLPIMDSLGIIGPLHQWPFCISHACTAKPDSLLQDIPEKTRNKVAQAIQEAHFANFAHIQIWESTVDFAFKPYYSVFAE